MKKSRTAPAETPPAVRLSGEFFAQSTRRLAASLLGTVLVRSLPDGTRLSGIVVETEAYLSVGDQASHSYRGPGKKNASMFQPAGTLYVYSIHTRHCLNVVTESEGVGAAVLIRAIEPLEGVDRMLLHRRVATHRSQPIGQLPLVKSLTSGPGRLCQALEVDRRLDGVDLMQDQQIWLEALSPKEPRKKSSGARKVAIALRGDDPPEKQPFSSADPTTCPPPWRIRRSPRIGISSEKALKLRYFIDGNHFVSGCARDHSAGRHWAFGDWNGVR